MGAEPFNGYRLYAQGYTEHGIDVVWRAAKQNLTSPTLPEGILISTHRNDIIIDQQSPAPPLPTDLPFTIKKCLLRAGFPKIEPHVWSSIERNSGAATARHTRVGFATAPLLDISADIGSDNHRIVYCKLRPEFVAVAVIKALILAYR